MAATGYSYTGGRPRCHPHWQAFAKCYAESENPSACVLLREDYLECLHHFKEAARNAAIRAELHRRASHSAEEAHSVAEILASSSTGTAPISVGLIAKHAEGSGDKSSS